MESDQTTNECYDSFNINSIFFEIYLIFFMHLLTYYFLQNAPVAQLVEQMTLNHRVEGSSPSGCTIFYMIRYRYITHSLNS